MNKTLVLAGTGTSQAVVQIVFVYPESWCVKGAYISHTGLFEFAPLPELPEGTPVIDMTAIRNLEVAKKIIARHSSISGIDNPGILVQLLQGLGAKVGYSVGGYSDK